jgi:regulator of nucleoside diphosphate kinase
MKEPFIFLSDEITRDNAYNLMTWLKDDDVRKFLSDTQNVSDDIERVISKVNMPILTHLFNQNGRFYMAYDKDGKPVGFVRLIIKSAETEIVIVIGDRSNWGKRLGTSTILESLKIAFFELRSKRVVAKIHKENIRSIRAFAGAGFKQFHESANMKSFSITIEEYIESVKRQAAAPGVIYITELDRRRLRKLISDELKNGADKQALDDLESEINRAKVVEQHHLPRGVVSMNSKALLTLNDDDIEVSLVYPHASDPARSRLSVLSPIGTAILGYSEGDSIRWDTPDGIAHIRIKKLLYQPEAAGHYHL